MGADLSPKRVAGERVFQFRDRADIARVQFGHRNRRLSLHDLRCARISPAPPRLKFCSVASFFSTPEKTLKYEIRPANASDTVLEDIQRNRLFVRLMPLGGVAISAELRPAPTRARRARECSRR